MLALFSFYYYLLSTYLLFILSALTSFSCSNVGFLYILGTLCLVRRELLRIMHVCLVVVLFTFLLFIIYLYTFTFYPIYLFILIYLFIYLLLNYIY